MFRQFRRKDTFELTPWSEGFRITEVQVSPKDAENGSPKLGDYVGRDLKNHKDLWLLTGEYVKENLELADGDSFHSIDELYMHRMGLTRQLTRYIPAHRSLLHSDGSKFEGMFIVTMYIEGKQCSYHYNIGYWDLFNHVETKEFADEWDDHSSYDVLDILCDTAIPK